MTRCIVLSVLVSLSSLGALAEDPQESRVVRFVEEHAHRVPVAEARKLGTEMGPNASQVLARMLTKPEYADHWESVVLVLGLLGQDTADEIITFLERGQGKLSREAYFAKASSILALGFVLNETGSESALRYLRDGTHPEVWRDRIHWTSPVITDPNALHTYLARRCFHGLGVAGRQEAREVLSQHSAAHDPLFQDVLDAAKELNVQANGLEKLYPENRK